MNIILQNIIYAFYSPVGVNRNQRMSEFVEVIHSGIFVSVVCFVFSRLNYHQNPADTPFCKYSLESPIHFLFYYYCQLGISILVLSFQQHTVHRHAAASCYRSCWKGTWFFLAQGQINLYCCGFLLMNKNTNKC